jgi:hypothetical protein
MVHWVVAETAKLRKYDASYERKKTVLILCNSEKSTMKMKILVGASVFASIVLLIGSGLSRAAVQFGDSLTFTGGDLGGPGGTFHVTDNTSGDKFDTFCVELFEEISYGGTYVVDGLSTKTISGGKSLTPFVAWLYDSFINHTLNGFSYSSASDANTLQYDIWTNLDTPFTDTQIQSVGGQIFPSSNSLLTAWQTEFDNSSWGNSLGGIEIINLGNFGDQGAANAQDQLVLIPGRPHNPPAPEPNSLIVWSLLIGTLGSIFIARRWKACCISQI